MSNDSDSHELKGIPIEALIGAPLQGAAKAGVLLADSTAEYIETVGFYTDEQGQRQTRNVDFAFKRPAQDERTGDVYMEDVSVSIPLLAIAPAPNLQIETIDVTFNLEVRSMYRETEEEDRPSSGGREESKGGERTGKEFQLFGKATTHKEHTRETDKSSKYHIELKAADRGVPEALARVLDLMAASVAPRTKREED